MMESGEGSISDPGAGCGAAPHPHPQVRLSSFQWGSFQHSRRKGRQCLGLGDSGGGKLGTHPPCLSLSDLQHEGGSPEGALPTLQPALGWRDACRQGRERWVAHRALVILWEGLGQSCKATSHTTDGHLTPGSEQGQTDFPAKRDSPQPPGASAEVGNFPR